MRVVNLQTFLMLEPGTVFAEHHETWHGHLQVKGKTILDGPEPDFFYTDLTEPWGYHELPINSSVSHTDLRGDYNRVLQWMGFKYRPEQEFVVLDDEDIKAMAYRLLSLAKDTLEVKGWAWRRQGMKGWALGHNQPTEANCPKFHEDRVEVRPLGFLPTPDKQV